jgi:EthD domain
MIKLVFMGRRRNGMTREEFQRYWREEHAEFVKRHADVLGISPLRPDACKTRTSTTR